MISYAEACSTKDDILINPVLQGALISVAIVFGLIAVALVFVYKKYRNLKLKYTELGDQDDNGAGEIEMQTK